MAASVTNPAKPVDCHPRQGVVVRRLRAIPVPGV